VRGQEQAQDTTSFTNLSQRFDDRVTKAARASRTIQEIINAPPPSSAPGASTDPHTLIGADRLRIIAGESEEPAAAGVPSGSPSASPPTPAPPEQRWRAFAVLAH
jgi:hypothetical protein